MQPAFGALTDRCNLRSTGSGLVGSASGDDKLTHDEWMRGMIFHTHSKSDAEFIELMDQIAGLLK